MRGKQPSKEDKLAFILINYEITERAPSWRVGHLYLSAEDTNTALN